MVVGVALAFKGMTRLMSRIVDLVRMDGGGDWEQISCKKVG